MSLQEATSALDSLTEQSIQTALSRVQSTRVTVAHRLSTIMDSDNIVVMKPPLFSTVGHRISFPFTISLLLAKL